MSAAEMQAALARLYVDEPFRRLFRTHQPVLDDYWLSAEERAAIEGIDGDQLEAFAASLKAKRGSRIRRAYPILFAIAPAAVEAYYSRYYQLHIARSDLTPQDDVLAFGRFVEMSAAGADHVPPFTSDVAAFERLYFKVRFTAQGSSFASRKLTAESVPRLADGVELVELTYDVGAIEELLESGRDPGSFEALAPSPSVVVMRPSTRTSAMRVLKVNASTRALIALSDGRRSVAEIRRAFERMTGADDLGEEIAAGLERLLALELLTLEPAGPAPGQEKFRAFAFSEGEGLEAQ